MAVAITIFNAMLPASVAFTPVAGWMLDSFPLEWSLYVLAAESALLGGLGFASGAAAGYTFMGLLVFGRFYFFSTLPYLMTRYFGDLGTPLYGYVAAAAALINLSAYWWTALVLERLNGDFAGTGGVLCAACVVASLSVAWFTTAHSGGASS